MLSVTKVTSADYYLRSTCTHEALTAEKLGPAEYELAAVRQGEPPGQWAVQGRNHLGLVGEVSPDQFRTLINDLRDPGTGQALGSRPRRFKSTEERMEAFASKHPGATPEARAAARVRAEAKKAQAVHALDLTFSPPKSWSVLHAALQRAGRTDEAEAVWAALRAGEDAALAQAAEELGWTRVGAGGPRTHGRSTASYEQVPDLVMARFRHHVSRERDPQLHSHIMLLNRVRCADGRWRALHAAPLMKSKHMLDATYLRVAEATLTRTLGVRFATRPDGKAREIVGVDERVREMFSARSRALTEEAQVLADEYTATRGHKPSALWRWQFAQRATMSTRKAKPDEAPSRAEDLERWERQVAREFRESLFSVNDMVDEARAMPDEPIVVPPLDRQAVIEQAIADLEQTKSTWNKSHLRHAISNRLPDMLAIEPVRIPALVVAMADTALAGREVVPVSAPAVAQVPRSIQADRTFPRDAPEAPRWTTARSLAREDGLVERLDHQGAPALSEASARAVLVEAGLDAGQLDVGVAILTSTNRIEIVNSAAGTGKTTLMAALSRASEHVWGHGLTGFAVAQNAASNLAEHGVATGHNIERWLNFRDRAARGEVNDVERAQFAVPRGATVVVDEASMVDTPALTRLVASLEDAGVGRIVLIGDTEQLDPVDAGGAFAMLCEQRAPHELETVRRFSHQWERAASARLRDGDIEALHQYDTRSRVHGDTDPERVRDMAVRAFLVDHRSGLESVVMVGSVKEAEGVSSMVREALVRAGEVERAGVALHDRNVAGIGDVVQTRLNRPSLGVSNRDVWQVVGTTSHGDLEVVPRGGGPGLQLPADYVGKHVELAYAGTVHATNGRTTDTAHLIADRMMGRSHAYPGLTRGRDANHAWVVLVDEETALGRLAQIVETDDHTSAARVAIAAEQDRADHLGHLGPQWQALVTEDRSTDHRLAIRTTLTLADADAVLADPASGGVLRMLRTAETTGHDPGRVLEQAMAGGSLAGARSPASVLFARLDAVLPPGAGPERRAFTYADRTPPARGERTVYARQLAEAMDARTRMLGERTADEAPRWAVDRWGEPPADPVERLAWCGRAAPVAAYREQHGWDHERNPIGPQPTRAEPERLWAWNRAADTLGMDPHEREMAALSRGELLNREQQWQRELAWMPRNVDEDLREAHTALEEARAQVVRAGEYEALDALADEAAMRERIDWLEEIAEVRSATYAATEAVRDRAQEARAEIERRGEVDAARLDVLEPEAPDAEQTAAAHAAVFERLAPGAELEEVPAFGSRQWVELDDEDPRKAAATSRAAARWWNLGEPLDRDLAATYERLAEHEQAQVEGRFELREREREASDDTGPDYVLDHAVQWEAPPERGADVETLAAVRSWSAPHLTAGEAPEFGSPEWVEVEDCATADAAEARAAMRWWNLGDDLDQVHERARLADEVATSHAVSAELREQTKDRVDQRSAAQLAEARGEELPEQPTVVEEPEPEPTVNREAYRHTLVEAERARNSETKFLEVAEDDEPVRPAASRESLLAELERARQAADVFAEREQPAQVAPPQVQRTEPERELVED